MWSATKRKRRIWRGDLLERRRKLMEQWAAFCARPMQPADVVLLRAVT